MKADFAPRATADLKRIGLRSRKVFGDPVAAALETFIRATVARIAAMPESGRQLPKRPSVRVVTLGRYPFKIFYTVSESAQAITVLHIRHAAQRPWDGE